MAPPTPDARTSHVTPEDSIRAADREAVLASLPEAVLAFAPDGSTGYVNPAAEDILGLARRNLVGRPASRIFASSPWLVRMLSLLDDDHPVLREEGELATPAGPIAVLAEATRMGERSPSRLHALLVLRDQGSRSVLQGRDVDRKRVVALERLAAQFAHEINNPLAGIRGAAQLLGRRVADRPELREYSDIIVRQVDRLGGLVEALMALEAPLLRREPVNVHRILNELLMLERHSAGARGIAFVAQFDPSLPDVVGDPDRLQQLFLNILRNAVSHCPAERGRVNVSTRMEHSYKVDRGGHRVSFLTVSIADNGPGIAPEDLEHIFSPLFSRRPGGHGMGLAIASAIAAAHEGGIRATNLPGGGADFAITLPLAPAHAIEPAALPEAPRGPLP